MILNYNTILLLQITKKSYCEQTNYAIFQELNIMCV